jgi:hypothetical protein
MKTPLAVKYVASDYNDDYVNVVDADGKPVPLGYKELRILAACYNEVERLAEFIIEHVPGEPSRSASAVDVAIRLLKETYATV